jgi:hypothetical protein
MNKAFPPAEVIFRATSFPSATRRPETTTFPPSFGECEGGGFADAGGASSDDASLFSKVFIVGLNLAKVDRIYPGVTLGLRAFKSW